MNADLKEKLQFAHVFEEHVYVTDEDLIERIIAGTYDSGRFDGVGKYITSRFYSEKIALFAIEKTLILNEGGIKEWLRFGTGKRFVVSASCKSSIGKGFAKGKRFSDGGYETHKCVVVLEADAHYRNYSIVTAYPVPNAATMRKIQEDRNIFCAKRRTQ